VKIKNGKINFRFNSSWRLLLELASFSCKNKKQVAFLDCKVCSLIKTGSGSNFWLFFMFLPSNEVSMNLVNFWE
jgi:hypothetical protein